MPTLLHIDASPRSDRSVSRQLTREFVLAWKEANPDGQIIYRDLGHNPVPLVTETFIAAVYTPPKARSADLRAAITTSDQLISELQTATDYVFGVPMYNFSVAAAFKAYIDQIVIPGRTYAYTADGSGSRTGLLKGKKATVIMSRGWLYRNGSPLSSCNLQEPWIRMILGFVGVTDIEFVVAEGTAPLDRGEVGRDEYLRPILEQVRLKAGLGLA
ncbi:MAG: NAD(P)H-dependent oxidoreductase [Verrucomicrobia bacterium]|nr:NAD(P)H-dependent oxidoreductase [Verrucomicrobiota bacterium]MBV8485850.1 NAD(P)H-dependent oxidoreductase [Verrucomicrobiota bacterium]